MIRQDSMATTLNSFPDIILALKPPQEGQGMYISSGSYCMPHVWQCRHSGIKCITSLAFFKIVSFRADSHANSMADGSMPEAFPTSISTQLTFLSPFWSADPMAMSTILVTIENSCIR
jgi:hypothetical protein